MYEKTIIVNDQISQWNVQFVIVAKSKFIESRLTFDYHFVYEKSFESTMKLIVKAQSFMSNSRHKTLFSANMKHDYWNVEVHSKNKHYLSFYVFDFDQLQFTRMSQKTKFFFFTFIEFMSIVLKLIFESNFEFFLLYFDDQHTLIFIVYYMNDIFETHITYEKQYCFFRNHLFSRLLWSQMKISLNKLKIDMHEIKILNQMHKVEEALNMKKKSIEKIKNWFTSQTTNEIKNFMNTIQSTRKWIQRFEKLVKFLQRLKNSKIE